MRVYPKHLHALSCFTAIFLLLACGAQQPSRKAQKLTCYQYYIPEDITWQRISENHHISTEALLVKNQGIRWGVVYPGSISLSNDTISIAQEAGYANSCYVIGNLFPGTTLAFRSNADSVTMKMDATIEFNGEKYHKSPYPVTNGCWCDWK